MKDDTIDGNEGTIDEVEARTQTDQTENQITREQHFISAEDQTIQRVKITKDMLVKKSNDLAMGAHNLEAWAMRILDSAIAAYNSTNKIRFSLKLRDVIDIYGDKTTHPYRIGEKLADSLMGNFLKIHHISANKSEVWVNQSLVRRCVYTNGEFEFVLDKVGVDLLNAEKNYTSYPLIHGIQGNKYQMKFFNIIASLAYKEEYADTLTNFRTRMDIEDSRWKTYAHLKERCIMPSIEEVNSTGLFEVTLKQEIKNVRKVIGLVFKIKKLDINAKPISENTPITGEMTDDEILEELISNGYECNPKDSDNLKRIRAVARSKKVDVREYIQSNIRYTWVQKERGKKIDGGYVITAVLNDYAAKTREAEAKKKIEAEEKQAKALESEKIIKAAELVQKKHHLLFSDNNQMISQLTDEDRAQVLADTMKGIADPERRKAVRNLNALEDIEKIADFIIEGSLKATLKKYMQSNYPNEYPDLITYAKLQNEDPLVIQKLEAVPEYSR